MAQQTVILTAAVTGAVHIPSMSPYLPITPEQIIDEAVAACQAGAAVVHLRTRDPQTGQPTGDPVLMQQVVEGVRNRCDVVIGITTGYFTYGKDMYLAVPSDAVLSADLDGDGITLSELAEMDIAAGNEK